MPNRPSCRSSTTHAQENLCASCNQPFRARSQSPRQAYCARTECQRERRRRWQQAKRLTDPDYKYNQRNAQRAWSRRHPTYWTDYRRSHPKYCELNRSQQRARHRSKGCTVFAKIITAQLSGGLPAGLYRLVPLRPRIAKKNLSEAEISWLSILVGVFPEPCKERIR